MCDSRFAVLSAVLLLALLGGCHSAPLIDTRPLDSVGMSYDSIQKAKSLNVTPPEVAEIAKVKQAGLSDEGCITLLQIFHGRSHPFDCW